MKKIIMILSVAIVLVCSLYLSVIKSSLNLSEIKSNMNRLLASEIDRYRENYFFQKKDVVFGINGKISLSVFPKVMLTVANVDLKEIQYGDYSLNANIKKIELKLSALSLLRKKINVQDAMISGVEITVQDNYLEDSYIKKEVVKKMIKLGENEVIGVKDKLKGIFSSDGNGPTLKEGYREVEVIEDRVVEVDNSEAKLMLLNLPKKIELGNVRFSKKIPINFSGVSLAYISDGSVQKEVRGIAGNITTGKNPKINGTFTLNNIVGNVSVSFKNIEKGFSFDLKVSNDLLDEISFNYKGSNLFVENFEELVADFNLNVKTTGFNNFLQWILLANSKYYYLLDYKKGMQFKTEVAKNKADYEIKSLTIKSEDIDIKGSLNRSDDKNNILIDVNNLNMDDIVLSVSKSKIFTDQDKISIFKIVDEDELLKIVKSNKIDNPKKSNVKINIKKMNKNNINLTNSVLDFEIINGSYRINNFIINLNDMEILVENQKDMDGLFVSDLSVKGKNFNNIAGFFDIPDILQLKEFNLKSKIFIYNGIIYLSNYEINGENRKINGFLEYSFGGTDNYIAYTANLDSLDMGSSGKETATMKEKFLWLNNFTKNVFMDLSVKTLKYGAIGDITDLRTKINFSPGYINFYDIKNANLDFIKELSGSISFDARGKSPAIDINIKINNVEMKLNTINYVVDIEKYKNLILKEPINAEIQSKYWINKLFSIPKFDEVNGKIDINIANLLINSAPLKDVILASTVQNGTFSIQSFKFNGLGGSTELHGILDLKGNKSINMILTDTIYSIEEVFKLFVNMNNSDPNFKGTIGIGGIIKGAGGNENIFDTSLNMQFKFIGKNLFIKKLGLDDLRNKLSMVYKDKTLLDMNVREVLFNETGTTFSDFNGSFIINNSISNLAADARGIGISTKLAFKINNATANTTIDALNTSAILNRVGKVDVPLYLIIKFNENFAKAANLDINTDQIDQYLAEIKKITKVNEEIAKENDKM
ncbi:hypothetical protein FACS1894152_3530 [Bacilli bacterium]|nr:hypothetical protein FACS1894152_3530 [Bacilli bacterium]